MSGRRLVVVEANEVPPRLFRWYADLHPRSTIGRLVHAGRLLETENHDEPDLDGRELYPSQAWATLATGVGHRRHGIYWYGDPKPPAFPLYWQLAARAGKRVGIVGTLHSSPLAVQAGDENIVFAIPDCFAAEPDTRPERFRSFQQLNLTLTRQSGRVAAARPRTRDLVTLATAPALGVRAGSLVELARLASGVLTRRIARERFRSAQFVLFADMFRRLVREHDPDLAVLFTNHVASAMHRYWYATFPDDWNETIYDAAWIARYRGEIEYAMTLLDRSIAGLLDVCETTGRVLMVCTAIGQRADTDVTDAVREFAVVRDPEQFVAALRVPGRFEIKPGMVPQIGLAFVDEASAEVAETYLATVPRAGLSLLVDRQGNVVTVSYDFPSGQRSIEIEGRVLQLREVGVAIEAVDDQRCAEHDPVGSLLVHGVVPATTTTRIDVRAFAPALLEVLGVEPPVWHEHRELGFDRRPATTTR